MLLQFNINNLKLKVEGVSEVAKELRIRIEDERKSLELMTFKNYSNLTLSCKNKILRWNRHLEIEMNTKYTFTCGKIFLPSQDAALYKTFWLEMLCLLMWT